MRISGAKAPRRTILQSHFREWRYLRRRFSSSAGEVDHAGNLGSLLLSLYSPERIQDRPIPAARPGLLRAAHALTLKHSARERRMPGCRSMNSGQ